MRCGDIFLGLILLPLCLSQFHERKDASIAVPSLTWGEKISSTQNAHNKAIVNKNKTRLSRRPFLPFSELGASAGPRTRNDGTTKSRIPKDTLTMFTLTDGLDDGFTTLDMLQKDDRYSPRNSFTIKDGLGGLHPDEVYYADKDLLIIKGGGFKGSQTYHEPLQIIDENSPKDFHDWRHHKVPSFSEEYNGNVATILAPPVNSIYWNGHPSVSPKYYPFSLFLPSTELASQSRTHFSILPPETRVSAPRNRLQFNSSPPIFNLQSPFIRNQNTLIYPNQGYITYPSAPAPKRKIAHEFSRNPTGELWFGHSMRNKILSQTVQKHFSVQTRYPHPNYPSSWISLADDVAVNYRGSTPKRNSDAELLPNFNNNPQWSRTVSQKTPRSKFNL